ncbi:MAG TPA: site-2 protease family protein [Holophagaceae bacterium]|nr:site-2 protease family protein [Holophagaceae bacterium]
MSWSWKLGTLAHIEIRVHATFLLLLAWVGGLSYSKDRSLEAALVAVAFILCVFATVVLHEMGHALTARRFGVRTLGITLLPIGGVAQLDRIPEKPREELLVALAGPAVNVVLALLLWAGLAGGGPLDLQGPRPGPTAFVARLAVVNAGLALFNLLPAFPMDGGRALRALLSLRMGRSRATRIAAHLGQAMALLFAGLGLLGNPFLVFIGLFVWLSAEEEARAVQVQAVLDGISVGEAMVTTFQTLAPEESLARARELLIHTFQRDFPVAREGGCLGLLTHQGLLRALAHGGEGCEVTSAMESTFGTATPVEPLSSALPRLPSAPGRTLLVMEGRRVVGLLTAENIGEMFLARDPATVGR